MQLLTPIQLGRLNPRNRVVMAPMTRSRADAAGRVGEATVRYYTQRATAGLIITEATNVSAEAIGSPMTPSPMNATRSGMAGTLPATLAGVNARPRRL